MQVFKSALILSMLGYLLACGSGGGAPGSAGSASGPVKVPPKKDCIADSSTKVLQLNASNYDKYTYVNLVSGEVLDLTPTQAANSNQWHFAMRRNNVLLNGDASGLGSVQAAIANAQDDFYLSNGQPNHSMFINSNCNDQEAAFLADYPANTLTFNEDKFVSAITLPPATEDTQNFIDYGWYKAHKDQAENRIVNSEWIWLIRSGEGNSYAKFKASSLSYSAAQGLSVSFDFETQLAGTRGFNTAANFNLVDVSNGSYCFDFDTNQSVNCMGDQWDIKLEIDGLNWVLKSNSGVSGEGRGGAFIRLNSITTLLFEEGEKSTDNKFIKNHYFSDKIAGVIDGAWYAYDLQAQHKLFPNYRVFMIDTNSQDANAPYVKLQILNYYDDNAISGYPTIRFKSVAK